MGRLGNTKQYVGRAAVAALAGALACAAVANAGGHDPAGVGDDYLPEGGNGGYDVAEYRIQVEYLPETTSITGRTVVQARATSDLDVFHLDFKQNVSEVRVNGAPAQFKTSGKHELVIRPKDPLRAGRLFWVDVTYAGSVDIPEEEQATGDYYPGVALTKDGGMIAVGQPHSSWWWFPSNDHPSDKATYSVKITAPEEFAAISNGLKVSEKTADGKTTTHWADYKPMASYLSFLTVGKYDVEESWSSAGGKSWTAIAKEGIDEQTRKNAQEAMDASPSIVKWATEQFGPYPFSSSGGVVPALHGAYPLENQTRPVYPLQEWDESSDTAVVVHEAAHQWFGNSVSMKKWRDIWINEGFATWAEWKYDEDHGKKHSNEVFEAAYRQTYDEDSGHPGFWELKIGDPGTKGLFEWAIYSRGAMTVQALRNRIGDDDHRRLLQAWTTKHAHGNASVAEFIELAEEISEEDLAGFFDAWLYTSARPAPTAANGVPDESWGEPLPEEEAAVAAAELKKTVLRHPHRRTATK